MLLTAVTFFAVLTVLVLIHELGHFVVARLCGVHVEEFGLGLPPKLFGRKIGTTEYTVNWLPIGGFVRLAGEDAQEGERTDTKLPVSAYFWSKSKKQRAAILSAGVIMNFLLAVIITAVLLINGVQEPTGTVRVQRVVPGSPAETAGLREGDIIAGLDEFPVITLEIRQPFVPKTPAEMISYVNDHKGKQVALTFIRGNERQTVVVVPRTEIPKGEGALGVGITDLELRRYSVAEAPQKALVITTLRARDMLVSIGSMIWSLVTLRPLFSGTGMPDIAGPIGIAQVTGQAVKFGWAAVLEFAGILSLNLAVLNVLPIPALDGGRLLFVFLEKALGRKVRPAFERSTHQVGMIVLLVLIALVSVNDILRILRGG